MKQNIFTSLLLLLSITATAQNKKQTITITTKLGEVHTYPKFNTHFRLIVTVTILSSFFLWALCPTNFILFEW